MRIGTWLLVVAAGLGSQTAAAQESIVLDEIVVDARVEEGGGQATGGQKGETIAQDSATASKTGASILETPRSVSVVTEQRIEDQGARSVQDAVSYSSGVYAAPYGVDAREEFGKVRGFEPDVYRDGLRSSFGYYNNTRAHPYTLERVEVLKGPASVLYGQGSVGGLINLISKLPEEEASREVYVEYGSFDRKEVGVDMTGALDARGAFLYRMIGVLRDADTQVDYVENDSYVLAPSLTWQPTADTSLTVLANLQRNESGSSQAFLPATGTALPGPLGRIPTNRFISEPGWDRFDTEQAAVTVLFDQRLNAAWSLHAAARYRESASDYRTMWPSNTVVEDDGTIERTAWAADFNAQVFVGDVRLNGAFATGAFNHKLALGVDYQRATVEDDYALSSDFEGNALNVYDPVYGQADLDMSSWYVNDVDPATSRQTGFYIQDQLKFGAGWIASLGLRYDIATDADDTTYREWSKDAGLMYRFDNGISPYVSYSESFLPHTERDGEGNAFAPERGRQWEAGVKYQPPGTPSIFTAAVFHITKENLLTFDYSLSIPGYRQIDDEVTARGFELEAQSKWGEFELLANYTYVETEDENGFHLTTVPEHLASAWLTWRPEDEWLRGFKAGFGLRYAGKTWDQGDTLITDPYVLADAMLGYETDEWGLTLTVRNLFDKEHVTGCETGYCYYGERRNAVLKLSTRF